MSSPEIAVQRHAVEQICEAFLANIGGKDQAAVMASLVFLCASMLAQAAKNEGHLLDGIRMTGDDIRTLACEMFVKYRPRK